MASRKRNYTRFYCLLKQVMPELSPEEAKETIVWQVSGERTTSLRNLTDEEYEEALELLNEQVQSSSSSKIRKLRSQALILLQKYGIDTTNWTAVNAFVSQPRIAGKVFYHLSEGELKALIRKMRAIVGKTGSKRQKSKAPQKENPEVSESNYKIIYIKRRAYVN